MLLTLFIQNNVLSSQRESSYCPEKAVLVEADPGDLQIVCNEDNVGAIPEGKTIEEERVLNVIKITKHPEFSPGNDKESRSNKKGPFAGYDISVYHVDDADFFLEEEKVWPACLPKLDSALKNEGSDRTKDFFAGWMDPEPSYRSRDSLTVEKQISNYFLPRETQVEKVKCADPQWMNSNTYYPPGTICYKDPTEGSCFQNGNSGSSVMTHFKATEKDGSTVDAFAYTGPLSMHKGCDQVSGKKTLDCVCHSLSGM